RQHRCGACADLIHRPVGAHGLRRQVKNTVTVDVVLKNCGRTGGDSSDRTKLRLEERHYGLLGRGSDLRGGVDDQVTAAGATIDDIGTENVINGIAAGAGKDGVAAAGLAAE